MRPASDPAERGEGLPLRPRFDEAEERDGSGVAHASSIESMETRVEKEAAHLVRREVHVSTPQQRAPPESKEEDERGCVRLCGWAAAAQRGVARCARRCGAPAR